MNADPNDMPAIREMLHEILRNDPTPLHLGIQLGDIDQGRVVMTMPIADHMANSHGMSHGGYLFTLADTALAYCCATAGTRVVTRNAEITFVAPAHPGEAVRRRVGAGADAGAHLRLLQRHHDDLPRGARALGRSPGHLPRPAAVHRAGAGLDETLLATGVRRPAARRAARWSARVCLPD